MNPIHATTYWEIKPCCLIILCLYSTVSISSCLVTAYPLLAFNLLTLVMYLIALFTSTKVGGALRARGGGGSTWPTEASAVGGAMGTNMGGGGGSVPATRAGVANTMLLIWVSVLLAFS